MEYNDDKPIEILKENIKKDLKKQYELGLIERYISGFNAALDVLYYEIKDIHNAEDIKRYIKTKRENIRNNLNLEISD